MRFQAEDNNTVSLLSHLRRPIVVPQAPTLSRCKGIWIPDGGWVLLLAIGLKRSWKEMLGSGMNLVTTVIGFGMSATFIVFVCTRLICGRIRNAESRAVFEMEPRIDLEQPVHRIGGVEPVVVSAIPTMKFNREAFPSEDAQCSICLGEYQEKEVLRILPRCGHNFHLSCIDVWLRKQSTCPVCRLPLHESLERKHSRQPMFSMVMDGPEIASDHSHQWLLPHHEHSEGSGSNQGHHESIPVDLQPPLTGEAETSR